MRGLDDSKHHWFLGAGMVHGVRLRDGRAEWYRNRWVRSKAVAGALPAGFAAHTKTDVWKAEVHAIAYSARQDHVQHIILDKTGRVSRITDIAVRGKPMMHDFALTEKYVVLYDLPVTFSLDAAKAGTFPYVWDPAHEARVGLVSRDGSSREPRCFPSSRALSFIRSTRTTMAPVSSSICAATQALRCFADGRTRPDYP